MTSHVTFPVYRPREAMEQEIRHLEARIHRLNIGFNAAVLEREHWQERAEKAEAQLAQQTLEEAS
jgi:hypothetical protein